MGQLNCPLAPRNPTKIQADETGNFRNRTPVMRRNCDPLLFKNGGKTALLVRFVGVPLSRDLLKPCLGYIHEETVAGNTVSVFAELF